MQTSKTLKFQNVFNTQRSMYGIFTDIYTIHWILWAMISMFKVPGVISVGVSHHFFSP